MHPQPPISTRGPARPTAQDEAAGRAGARAATPNADAGHPLVGAWVVDPGGAGSAGPPVVAVWEPDGRFVDADARVSAAWQAIGPRTALHTFVRAVGDDGSGYVVVSGVITIDRSGDRWTQSYSVMVVAADGPVRSAGKGTARATRLGVAPPAAVGAPLPAIAPSSPATTDTGSPIP